MLNYHGKEVEDESGNITTYHYALVDSNVHDGMEYTYSVTAYDTGVMSDEVIISQDLETGEWVSDTLSVPDPNGWGLINSFQYLENLHEFQIHFRLNMKPL